METIFVVDDSDGIRKPVSEGLRDAGYVNVLRFSTVDSAALAIDALHDYLVRRSQPTPPTLPRELADALVPPMDPDGVRRPISPAALLGMGGLMSPNIVLVTDRQIGGNSHAQQYGISGPAADPQTLITHLDATFGNDPAYGPNWASHHLAVVEATASILTSNDPGPLPAHLQGKVPAVTISKSQPLMQLVHQIITEVGVAAAYVTAP